jgi:hypothetical protein
MISLALGSVRLLQFSLCLLQASSLVSMYCKRMSIACYFFGSSLFRVGGSLFPPTTLSVRRRVSDLLHTQRGQPIQRGGRLSLVRQTFVNAGLRPPPSAAVGVDKGSPRQLCSPPSVRRKRMAEPPSPTAKPASPTPNSEEAIFPCLPAVVR